LRQSPRPECGDQLCRGGFYHLFADVHLFGNRWLSPCRLYHLIGVRSHHGYHDNWAITPGFIPRRTGGVRLDHAILCWTRWECFEKSGDREGLLSARLFQGVATALITTLPALSFLQGLFPTGTTATRSFGRQRLVLPLGPPFAQATHKYNARDQVFASFDYSTSIRLRPSMPCARSWEGDVLAVGGDIFFGWVAGCDSITKFRR